MNKIALFLNLVLFFLAGGVQAQLRLIYNESFLSNKAGWPTADEATHMMKIHEGHYELQVKNGDSRWVYNYPSINPKIYFIIEIKVKMKPISEDCLIGVVWNNGDKAKNLFYWYRNGTVGAEKKENDVTTDLGTENSGMKFDDDLDHVIKVKSFSNRCEFYIDDKLVKKTEKLPYKYNNGVGVYFGNQGTTYLDYIKVYQEREEVNLVQTDFKITNKENLGTAVNTHYSEVQPVISHDGNELYFSRKEYPKNTGSTHDDVWYSTKDANNIFSTAQNLGKPVNNSDYNSVAGFSADGKKMVAFGKYSASGNYIGEGFCEFTKTASGWGNPQNLDIKNYYNSNDHCESSYSPDGSVLILTIERKDTHGGKDVYVSLKQPDGTWSAPFNAGGTINSFADEISPFLAGDNKTLYFASEGLPGYGQSDVFMTRRLDDTWQNWSKPVNMGPVINSSEWDAYFSIDAKGDWAYMVSNNHSVGKTDIFRFKIPHELKPDTLEAERILALVKKEEPVTLVKIDTLAKKDTTVKLQEAVVVDTIKESKLNHGKFHARIYGKVYDAKTKQPLPAPIVIRDLEHHHEVYTTCGEIEGFDATVDEGFNYDIYANYTGYVVQHVNVDLTTVHGDVEKQVDVYLVKVEKDNTIVMNSIFFEDKSSELRYDSRGELNHIASLMKENPTMRILIGGHTTANTADPRFNMKLSEDRAKEVFKALVKLGVERKRMEYKGYGNSKPMFDTNNAWENAKNRRVDFTILSL